MTDPREHDGGDAAAAADIGRGDGLRYVYAGNLPGQVGDLEDTRCAVVRRAARRALRVPHPRLSHHARTAAAPRAPRRCRAAGARVRRPDHLAAFHSRVTPPRIQSSRSCDLMKSSMHLLDRSAGRCATCGCRSPTAATSAANTACRRTTTSGCRARTCCTSRRSSALVDVFLSLGVDKVRLTGGEPLLRRDLPSLVAHARGEAGLDDLALTTNGVLLADQVDALQGGRASAGSPSASTRCSADRFVALTRFDQLDARARAASPRRTACSARSRSTPSSSAASTTTSWCRSDRVRHDRSTPRSASSSTWTSAAPRRWSPATASSRAREMLERR